MINKYRLLKTLMMDKERDKTSRLFISICLKTLFLFSVAAQGAFALEKPESTEIKLEAEISQTQIVSAKEIVQIFQSELLTVMKQGKELGFKGRYQALEKAILKSHDIKKIARIVVGKEWKVLSEEQQVILANIFTQLSISAYAYNFKTYSGESFDFISEDETARGGMIIHTTLTIPSDDDVKFDYMLKRKGDDWRIINIIANGVSDLALKRSEYTSILKREGFEALIAKISEKIDNYAK